VAQDCYQGENSLKAAVLQAANDEACAGNLENLKGTGKVSVKLD
jgi:hypothetical protein